MGVSSDLQFYRKKGNCSMYGYEICYETGQITHRVLALANADKPNLSAIIHEINECETNEILLRILREDYNLNVDKAFLVLTADMFHRNPELWLQKRGHSGINSEIWITHLISPYGCCNCCMPRAKHRARW